MTRVLLVEDEDLLRNSLDHLLRRAGLQVHAVRTAAEALLLPPDFVPDVLVTDWLLPGDCDGIQLAHRLRQSLPDLRVIVITGLLARDARGDIERDGVVSVCMEKPFLFAQLLEVIERTAA